MVDWIFPIAMLVRSRSVTKGTYLNSDGKPKIGKNCPFQNAIFLKGKIMLKLWTPVVWIPIMDQKPKPKKRNQQKTSAEHVKKHTKTLFQVIQHDLFIPDRWRSLNH